MTDADSAVVAEPTGQADVTSADQRLNAFCSPAGPEVFHSIVHQQDVWTRDPFDVETIHGKAREVFHRLLHRAATPSASSSGRVLLLLGESGSGKTHLMRAFRTYVHANERGYCGYLQMTSLMSNYAGYVLSKLIDALDQPYRDPEVQMSGLARLSLGLLESLAATTPEERQQFRDGYVPDLSARVDEYADQAVTDPRFSDCDLDLIRAMFYLQRDDPRIKKRLLKWLRCEDLAPGDRALLGHLVPRIREEAPLNMITQFGQLMLAVHGMPLVLCVDQLEEMATQDTTPDRFRRAMDTLVAIADTAPSSVVVISCLEDYFAAQKQHLMKPKLDRIERDPEPVRLTGYRSVDEVEALVARRLQVLYDELDVPYDGGQPTFPFTRSHLESQAGKRTRDVLDFCRQHREKCVQLGKWVEPGIAPPPPPPPPPPPQLEQAWNDFLAGFKASISDEEEDLAQLFAWAVKQCSEELPSGHFFGSEAQGRMVPVEVHGPDNSIDRLLLAVCDKSAKGGGLGKQITEVEKLAGETPIVILRSTPFPAGPTAAVSKQIAAVLKRGGRRVVVENTDWRTMLAFQQFQTAHGQQPEFAEWVRQGRPLSQLASIRHALALESLLKSRPVSATSTPAVPVKPVETPQPKPTPAAAVVADSTATGPLVLGTRAGVTAGTVTIDPKELTQHAAFLGGSGSGKTTAALNLIEQLLERGIPAVLLDRKGDLCRYADPSAWGVPLADPQQAARRQRLRERLDVAVFTPGQPAGRPLTIPVVPDGMDQLPTLEREQLAGYAAAALAGMMGYKPKGADQSRQAILGKAIEVLAMVPGADVTVPALRQLVEDRDDALLAAVGGFDDRLYKKLDEELLTLWLRHKNLLAGDAERLDIDALLGRNGHSRPGKTRLSVISTRFLGDAATVDFWVAQFLVTLGRWIGKRPSDQLQAVFLFDEADQYLPAQRQPATKAPMENLLKRARSAGVGLMLATQSPGDFDYKCRDTIRTWLVGRVKEQTALNKLKPMLSECKVDVTAKLPGQGTGQFHLLREREVTGVQAQRSLVSTEQLSEERIMELARAGRAGVVV